MVSDVELKNGLFESRMDAFSTELQCSDYVARNDPGTVVDKMLVGSILGGRANTRMRKRKIELLVTLTAHKSAISRDQQWYYALMAIRRKMGDGREIKKSDFDRILEEVCPKYWEEIGKKAYALGI